MNQPLSLATALERFAPAIVATEWLHGCLDVVFVNPTRIEISFLSFLYDMARVHEFDVELTATDLPADPRRVPLHNFAPR